MTAWQHPAQGRPFIYRLLPWGVHSGCVQLKQSLLDGCVSSGVFWEYVPCARTMGFMSWCTVRWVQTQLHSKLCLDTSTSPAGVIHCKLGNLTQVAPCH